MKRPGRAARGFRPGSGRAPGGSWSADGDGEVARPGPGRLRVRAVAHFQPDHLDSTYRGGYWNPPDSSQLVQTEWFQCPLPVPAPVADFSGWKESHRPAVPEEIICSSNSCMQVWVYTINANYLGGVFIDDTRSTQPQVFVSIGLSWFQLLQKRHARAMIFFWTLVCFRLHIKYESSIYMWAYGVEICFSPPASKHFYSILPHIVSKGRVHAFNT